MSYTRHTRMRTCLVLLLCVPFGCANDLTGLGEAIDPQEADVEAPDLPTPNECAFGPCVDAAVPDTIGSAPTLPTRSHGGRLRA